MSAIPSTPAATARLTLTCITTGQAAGVSIDGGSGFGTLVIGTSSLSGTTGVLATITLLKPSFSVSGKVATALGVPISATPSANGIAALAEYRDSTGATVYSGLVVSATAGPGVDVVVSTTTFQTTVNVDLISATITSP